MGTVLGASIDKVSGQKRIEESKGEMLPEYLQSISSLTASYYVFSE
ncbi:hypothetical protein ACERII_16550 [Evansella sp. AB-rgal1]